MDRSHHVSNLQFRPATLSFSISTHRKLEGRQGQGKEEISGGNHLPYTQGKNRPPIKETQGNCLLHVKKDKISLSQNELQDGLSSWFCSIQHLIYMDQRYIGLK